MAVDVELLPLLLVFVFFTVFFVSKLSTFATLVVFVARSCEEEDGDEEDVSFVGEAASFGSLLSTAFFEDDDRNLEAAILVSDGFIFDDVDDDFVDVDFETFSTSALLLFLSSFVFNVDDDDDDDDDFVAFSDLLFGFSSSFSFGCCCGGKDDKASSSPPKFAASISICCLISMIVVVFPTNLTAIKIYEQQEQTIIIISIEPNE